MKKTVEGVEEGMPSEASSPLVMTIGHSTHTLEKFIGLLQTHGVTCVVDVRTVPRSRHNPQFNRDSLPDSLKKVALGYVHLPGLGGLRHTKGDSPNMGWRNASFRGFADYMQTPEFVHSLEELIHLAGQPAHTRATELLEALSLADRAKDKIKTPKKFCLDP